MTIHPRADDPVPCIDCGTPIWLGLGRPFDSPDGTAHPHQCAGAAPVIAMPRLARKRRPLPDRPICLVKRSDYRIYLEPTVDASHVNVSVLINSQNKNDWGTPRWREPYPNEYRGVLEWLVRDLYAAEIARRAEKSA